MKLIRVILNIVRGSCAEEEKSVEVYVYAMSDLMKNYNEAEVILGILVAMLTAAFVDLGTHESFRGASSTIKITCDSRVRTLYDKNPLIPYNGNEHLGWLNKICDELRKKLLIFLISVVLKPSKGTRP